MAKLKAGDIVEFTAKFTFDGLSDPCLMFIYKIHQNKDNNIEYYHYDRIKINPIGPTERYSCAVNWLDNLPGEYIKQLNQIARILYYTPPVYALGTIYEK